MRFPSNGACAARSARAALAAVLWTTCPLQSIRFITRAARSGSQVGIRCTVFECCCAECSRNAGTSHGAVVDAVEVAQLGVVLQHPRYLSALRTIVFSIVSTMGSVFWTSLLLVILFYLFGVLNTQIATDHCRALTHAVVPQKCDPELIRFWSSVPQAMLTLFLSITNGISWDECLQPLWDVSRVAIVSLIVYIVITVFAVLNTVAASADGACMGNPL